MALHTVVHGRLVRSDRPWGGFDCSGKRCSAAASGPFAGNMSGMRFGALPVFLLDQFSQSMFVFDSGTQETHGTPDRRTGVTA
jgi:hypothetical protein